MGALKDTLKRAVGQLAELTLPTLGQEIDEDRNPGRAASLKRAILYARLRRAHGQGDVAAMDQALAAFWRGQPGDAFHARFADDRIAVFRERHAVVIEALADLIAASGTRYSRLVEIGCGDGRVLAEFMGRLPSIGQAVGLDINRQAIARARREHGQDGRLAFAVADAKDWLAAHALPGTVMVSNGGVLEYFSAENLDRLLAAVALAAPAAVVLVEPAAPGHDLANDPDSFAFGREYSFSHNYAFRLRKAGFKVVFEQEMPAFGARLVAIVAVIDTAGQKAGDRG